VLSFVRPKTYDKDQGGLQMEETDSYLSQMMDNKKAITKRIAHFVKIGLYSHHSP
jgi:hypothetical protein